MQLHWVMDLAFPRKPDRELAFQKTKNFRHKILKGSGIGGPAHL